MAEGSDDGAARPRARRPRPGPDPVGLGLALVVGLPVLAAGLRLVLGHWTPTADDAFIVTRSFDVFSTRPPLTGAHSLAGSGGPAAHSPGPLLYLVLAIPVRLGAVALLPLYVATINALLLAWCTALARRRGGTGFAVVVALGALLLLRAYGLANAASIWNPSAGRIPLLLLAFLVWSVLDGEHRLLPAAALVGSFTLQAHLSFGPPSVLLLGLAGLAVLVPILRSRPVAADADDDPPDRDRWRPLALAAVVLAACWALPAYEQLTRDPGNLAIVAESARDDRARGGPDLAVGSTGRALGVPPAFTRDEDDVSRGAAASFDGARPIDVAATAVGLLALAVVGARAWRQGRRHLWTGALVAGVLVGAVGATASSLPQTDLIVAVYAFTWFAGAGLVAWLVIGLGAADAVADARRGGRDRRDPRSPRHGERWVLVAGGAAAGLLALVLIPLRGPDRELDRSARELGAAVVDGTTPGGRYLIGRSGPYDLAFTSVLGQRLRTSGRSPVTTGAVVDALGEAYRADGRRCDGILVLQPAADPVPAGARDLVVVDHASLDPALARMRAVLLPEAPGARSC